MIPGIWNCRCGKCSGEYYPEGKLILKRKEYRLEFENPWTEPVWSDYIRETKIPGAWIVVTAVSRHTWPTALLSMHAFLCLASFCLG